MSYLNNRRSLTTTTTEDSKHEHGIGAMVEKKYSNTTRHGSDDSRIQSVIFTTIIEIRNNKFGEQFAINCGSREDLGSRVATWTLNGILMLAAPEAGATGQFAQWVYTGVIESGVSRLLWLADGYAAFHSKYKPYNLYQKGGRIEDKLAITTTTFKDGHVYEKIKGTYSVWGKSSIPTVATYCNKEGII